MMEENRPHPEAEPVEKIYQASSSSDSDSEKHLPSGKTRLFGRKKPVHTVLGGGKSADIILWRDKQIAASILVGVTSVWYLFEGLGYHLLTLLSHSLMLALGGLFLWSNLASFINKSPPQFPEIVLPEDVFVSVGLSLRHEVNRALKNFRLIASGKDLRKFFKVILVLWLVSVVGSWFNFLTLFYLVYIILHTVPLLYEKHEDQVDTLAQKAMVEINKQYAVLDEKVLKKLPSKLPSFKDKKHQ